MAVMMRPLANEIQMGLKSQGEITATSHPFLENELLAASGAIRGECGWHIAPTAEVTYRRVSRNPQIVYLPASQIQSISAVKINGAVIDIATVEFDELTGETNIFGRIVEIEFIAGYDEIPEDLTLLTLELAAGGLGAGGVLREQSGSVSVTYARANGDLTPTDRNRLTQYRLGRRP